MDAKERAAAAAVNLMSNGTVVGLGTGSTAECFIRALAEALRSGKLQDIRGVPTSKRSEELAHELRIPLVTLAQAKEVDVDVDGADEIDSDLNLIKGLGGALLREKIVAQNATRMIVIADANKRVDVLGTRAPLPVEVVHFAFEVQEPFLKSLGCVPTLRTTSNGAPFLTDNGNVVYDCRFPRIDDPAALQSQMKRRAGIVETGLFIGIADTAIVADADRVITLTSPQ
jgi:ribose 5-phosphate isomerase A